MGEQNKTFFWYNEPDEYSVDKATLEIRTKPSTDFWQRTHYGFRRDDGHCYLTEVKGDFSFSARFEFAPNEMYDQCGVILRIDEENWVKASTEYEDTSISRLGSVVTNLGFSDWATTDISTEVKEMSYRLSVNGKDVLIENSYDGQQWNQMRILHIHQPFETLQVGVYACSPKESSFVCKISEMTVGENQWRHHE